MSADSAVAPKKEYRWQGLRVPFIAPWSAERTLPGDIVRRVGRGGAGIGYADELSHVDRRRGVLWTRQAVARGSGIPCLPGMHALRQRQAVSHMLCQVCGGTTFGDAFERWGERHLFVARAADGRPLGEGERTVMAPVCLRCAVESVDACPHLRKGWTAALASYAQPWGVAGITLHATTLRQLPLPAKGLHMVPAGHPAERWTIAMREVSTLHGVTPISLDDLVRAA
ncbi:hypothetical protein [Streptomyces sp. SID3915]|uniref:hypothetical protein n=1 Tax=Streptomyces sp. SID3915 TaxID=2690263 RepID=UPI001367D784|nr:hypothetical protein [Streptomyces sp. SID3915]MYX77618.1 hypothetical protein [Streptomyces sp. SID3915]